MESIKGASTLREVVENGRGASRFGIRFPTVLVRPQDECAVELVQIRGGLLRKHKEWLETFPEASLLSRKYRSADLPVWTVLFTAELAWILLGHEAPEDLERETSSSCESDPFIHETLSLWRYFVRQYWSDREDKIMVPQSDTEFFFKAALSAYVTQEMKVSKASFTRSFEPEISQAWYLLFGEAQESEDIHARLPELVDYLQGRKNTYVFFMTLRSGRYFELGGNLAAEAERTVNRSRCA